METRSNYALVGGFVLSFLLAMVVFIIWLSNSGFRERVVEYDIFFDGSVSGLKKGSVVNYRGVPIGSVYDIVIDPTNVEKILVRVRINQDVTIKQDSLAHIESQGLTGVSIIQITGGTKDSPVLKSTPGRNRPVIPSKSSLLEQVAGSMPELLARLGTFVDDMRSVLNEENRKALGETLKNLQLITASIVPSKDKSTSIIEEIEALTQSFTQTMKVLNEVIQENRKGFKDLSTAGFTSFQKFLQEGRDAFAAVRRVSESLERSPTRFLYNDPKQGVKVK
jgi:phospholipid/cholesterol/gamma-HCH transport system substrate-binding protein